MQTGRDELPSFLELEACLLDEEMQLKLDAEKDGDAEALHLQKRKSKTTQKPPTPWPTQPDRRNPKDESEWRNNNRSRKQRPKHWHPKKCQDQDEDTCHYYGEPGHFERDCHLKKAIERVKTLKNWLKSKKGKKFLDANSLEKNKMSERKGSDSDSGKNSSKIVITDVLR
jgi:hypothetical protein